MGVRELMRCSSGCLMPWQAQRDCRMSKSEMDDKLEKTLTTMTVKRPLK